MSKYKDNDYRHLKRAICRTSAYREISSQCRLKQTEIWLYSPFPDWIRTKLNFICIQINRKMVNTVRFGFNLTRLRRDLCVHWEKSYSISFHIEWDMMMVTVFLSIWNRLDFQLVQNRKGNCHHDHIPFNVKGNGNRVLSV